MEIRILRQLYYLLSFLPKTSDSCHSPATFSLLLHCNLSFFFSYRDNWRTIYAVTLPLAQNHFALYAILCEGRFVYCSRALSILTFLVVSLQAPASLAVFLCFGLAITLSLSAHIGLFSPSPTSCLPQVKSDLPYRSRHGQLYFELPKTTVLAKFAPKPISIH